MVVIIKKTKIKQLLKRIEPQNYKKSKQKMENIQGICKIMPFLLN